MTNDAGAQVRPRDRILGTARALFGRCGIRATGVDAIAETAGTNKMTLYRHFQSKDALIVACLEQAASDADQLWEAVEASAPGDPRAQLDAWVEMVDGLLKDSRGCEFSNAAVELPEACDIVRDTITHYKKTQRTRLAQLCRDSGIPEPERLADTLALMVEGARISRQAVGADGPADSFTSCARTAIGYFASVREPA
ncbi:TetR/AcrR family transcriptional regulator [Mangrovibrevibacter kandeliae]|uniref:TetR/AcrR family transcriptional regulator n=1 Tax=Mangrovibrevibacter kandeliae TaxID=2968473 RepID=UPI0021197F54|nr:MULTISPECIES: TetR/AcrR family transcriptional regulator [unclassified Aurantimonas]MCQ8783362.1 TetR/AcrR family transcriptional regulator [Aurantimonas sp. CSK15Z-1]MCW4116123.1 TetR/AcrR family transcriptional regulator [Aurantimonas sp. MSK8Z-1]